MMKPFILGVAGGSGSGKTYFVKDLLQRIGESRAISIYQDDFYIDQSAKFDQDGGSVNFDHPSALDFELLSSCLRDLKKGFSTDIPSYDFSSHKRKSLMTKISPRPLILVDGILILHSPEVRACLDAAVFFDTPEELRFQRRLRRDVQERGRTPEGVFTQFYRQVQPMHESFVQPSKQHARWVFQDYEQYEEGLLKVEGFLRYQLGLESFEKASLF